MKLIIFASLAVIALASTVFMTSPSVTETPEYKVVTRDGEFEIRNYSPMLVASASMSSRSGSAFGKLFGYISGKNDDGEKIAMTSPVLRSQSESGGRMSFLIPKNIAAKGAPLPTSGDVKIETIPGGRFAAVRFSGYATDARYRAAARSLVAWLDSRDIKTEGLPVFAGYDPPYTPADRRRNEVLIRLADR